jgi:ankyrin repeat protein
MEVSSIPEDIQRACRLGDVNLLKKILKDQPRLLNQVDDKLKWSPLYRTVICGHLEATQYLLGLGADPNIKNNLGETALHQAVDNSQYKLVKILLKHKADPSMQQNGKT